MRPKGGRPLTLHAKESWKKFVSEKFQTVLKVPTLIFRFLASQVVDRGDKYINIPADLQCPAMTCSACLCDELPDCHITNSGTNGKREVHLCDICVTFKFFFLVSFEGSGEIEDASEEEEEVKENDGRIIDPDENGERDFDLRRLFFHTFYLVFTEKTNTTTGEEESMVHDEVARIDEKGVYDINFSPSKFSRIFSSVYKGNVSGGQEEVFFSGDNDVTSEEEGRFILLLFAILINLHPFHRPIRRNSRGQFG